MKEGTVMSDTLQMTVPEQPEIPVGTETRRETVWRKASELFQQNPDWVTFFRAILGVDGMVRKVFSTPEELLAFEQEAEYAQIQQMLAKLRERKEDPSIDIEPTRVITVRLPKSLHEYLKTEAHERHTSMNKLCISKLLQMIDNELVPCD
jgi:predicted HicB family RNase H-like nuclease